MTRRPTKAPWKISGSLLLAGLLGLAGCGQREGAPNWPKIGDAAQGAIAIGRSGCGSCHLIPGIQHADGLVGPPLAHFSERTIIAGVLPNTPPNLVQWVQHPQQVVPGNAMPDGHLTDQEARDIAAYLLTLR
jgi:cytochrome c